MTVARNKMEGHQRGCGREEVKCPCPGCEERMLRAEVEEHVAVSGTVHMWKAWGRAVEMEKKVEDMEKKSVEMETKAVEMEKKAEAMGGKVADQDKVIVGLQKRAAALTRVFTWSTDSEWSLVKSVAYTFTGGVVGICYSEEDPDDDDPDPDDQGTHFIGFRLEEGPDCTMHFKCSILDKNDKVLRVCQSSEAW